MSAFVSDRSPLRRECPKCLAKPFNKCTDTRRPHYSVYLATVHAERKSKRGDQS